MQPLFLCILPHWQNIFLLSSCIYWITVFCSNSMPLLPSLPLTQTPFLRTNRQENCCTGRAKQQDNNNNSIACKISYLLETKEKEKNRHAQRSTHGLRRTVVNKLANKKVVDQKKRRKRKKREKDEQRRYILRANYLISPFWQLHKHLSDYTTISAVYST